MHTNDVLEVVSVPLSSPSLSFVALSLPPSFLQSCTSCRITLNTELTFFQGITKRKVENHVNRLHDRDKRQGGLVIHLFYSLLRVVLKDLPTLSAQAFHSSSLCPWQWPRMCSKTLYIVDKMTGESFLLCDNKKKDKTQAVTNSTFSCSNKHSYVFKIYMCLLYKCTAGQRMDLVNIMPWTESGSNQCNHPSNQNVPI